MSAAEWQYSREAENIEKRKQELGIYGQDKIFKKVPKLKQTNKQTKRPFYHFVLVLAESWVQTLSFGSGSGQDLF